MDVSTESGDWDSLRGEAVLVRFAVFVMEQSVPEELELDMLDPLARHWLVRDGDGEAIATARLTPDGRIGRMAVLADWRGRGIGTSLLQAMIAHARSEGMAELTLHAQVTAIPFYQRLGFEAEGPEFDDAGIPHRAMRLPLGDAH